MCTKKKIKLSLDKAIKMYGKNPEMDELLLANFSKEELEKPNLPKTWADLRVKSGYVIRADSAIIPRSQFLSATYEQKNLFATEKQAKSALAMAQLSQLMKVYNGDWEADYSNPNQVKFQIVCVRNIIETNWELTQNEFLSFKSAELRDYFLKNFEPLIKEYFMID